MNETKTKHTTTPWVVINGAICTDEGQKPIANMVRDSTASEAGIYPVERDENARFIVTACNHFEEMKTLLERATFGDIPLALQESIDILLTRIEKEG